MLGGITVLDFSLQLPGPYATMLLRALGARVISVEPPGGDPAREFDPRMVETLDSGKDRLEIDLKQRGALEVVHRLTAGADVVVEGFRPGVAARLGIGYDDLRAHRADLVYCSISGYGQTGPYRLVAGHDVNYLGVGGGLGSGAGESGQIGIPLVDLATGTSAALSIAAALFARARTSAGAYLDLAMLDSAVFWSQIKAGHGTAGGGGEPAVEPGYGVFTAADGKRLTLGAVEEKFWSRLCAVLGWSEREPTSPSAHEDVAGELAKRPRAEWLTLLAAADVPAAPVNEADEIAADEQVVERQLYAPDGSGIPMLRPPLPASTIAAPRVPVPVDALLAEFGFETAEREALFDARIVGN